MSRPLRFGVVGLGLMGREFASAAARWCHLDDLGVHPVITAVCDTNPGALEWFKRHVPTLRLGTTDYRELLAHPEVDAVYCAVPHHLHEQLYTDIIRAGKHLLGEKPFGIDLVANARIGEAIAEHPEVLVRCSSEFPFYPGAQAVFQAVESGRLGRIIELEAGFLHSSDLDPEKPLNWKRMARFNGDYGCLGDLGLHVLHLPLRFGWRFGNVHALLSNLVPERPDGRGGRAPCDTPDNATLACDVQADGPAGRVAFPALLHTKRIAPGETNTWFIRVHGMAGSAEFSTKYPKTFRFMSYEGGAQVWGHQDLGFESVYRTITGNIFEFGFTDAVLQMWAAFCDEVAHGREGMRGPFWCATPEEAAESHRLFTAALASQRQRAP